MADQEEQRNESESDKKNWAEAENMSEEQRQKLMEQCAQEFGYITPGRSDTSSTASAAKRGVTTTSSASGPSKPRRTIQRAENCADATVMAKHNPQRGRV